jgi:hypothetical protein
MSFFKNLKNFFKDFINFIDKEFLTRNKKNKSISSIYLEGEDSYMPQNEALPFIKKK